jgi:hypothetical protein
MRFHPSAVRPALLFFVALAIGIGPRVGEAGAQDTASSPTLVLSDSAVVSVLTVLPGNRLYNLFGHTIIRVRDPVRNLDVGFNYGTFDFPKSLLGGAGFVARFAYGDLDYKLAASGNPSHHVEWYWTEEGRPTIEQTLDLERAEAQELFDFLVENARPENAVYRYDFFFDNCSTRPRDVIESVLGDQLQQRYEDPGTSFRRLLDPYLTANPGIDLSMDVGLGQPADREATARDALFLPVELMNWLDRMTVQDPAGEERSLVSRTDTLTWAPGAGERERVSPWPTILAWMIAALLLLLTLSDRRSGRGTRRWFDGSLLLLVGLAGLVLSFLVLVSLHAVTDGNLNLMWALPTHVLAGGTLLSGRRPAWLRPYMLLTTVLAAVFLVGIPFWPQEIPAAVIPFVLGIAARASLLAFPSGSESDSNGSQDADALSA